MAIPIAEMYWIVISVVLCLFMGRRVLIYI